jgi:hypothetical protein
VKRYKDSNVTVQLYATKDMLALECAEQEKEVVFVQNGKARTEGRS